MTTVHIVALPHTKFTREYEWCAYTGKLWRFTQMLALAGHTPVMYGPEGDLLAEGTEHVQIINDEQRLRWFGSTEWDANTVFSGWDDSCIFWQEMNATAAVAIAARWKPGDIVGLIGGLCQRQVITHLRSAGIHPVVWEWGIGYEGVVPDTFRTFESYAWAHHVAGRHHEDDFRPGDSVVPNCFDTADFAPSTKTGEYLLFIGRPTPRKGLPIVEAIAQHSDIPLKIAGQPGFDVPGAEHVGIVTGRAKAELFAGAYAVLAPTTYLEPFGGVVVEAMLSGTPVITTDWGAFTETVMHGVTGFRCRTISEFLKAVRNAEQFDREAILSYATSRFTLEVGAQMYDRVIHRIAELSQAAAQAA